MGDKRRRHHKWCKCVKCKNVLYAKCQNCDSRKLKRYLNVNIMNEYFFCKKCRSNSHWIFCDNCFTSNPLSRFGYNLDHIPEITIIITLFINPPVALLLFAILFLFRIRRAGRPKTKNRNTEIIVKHEHDEEKQLKKEAQRISPLTMTFGIIALLIFYSSIREYQAKDEQQQQADPNRRIADQKKIAEQQKKIQEQQKLIEQQNKLADQQKAKEEKEQLLFSKYKDSILLSPKEFRKFIAENKQEIKDNRLSLYIKEKIEQKASVLKEENKELLDKLNEIKKTKMPREDKKAKVAPLAEKGRGNNNRLGELQEMMKFLDD